MEDETKVDPLYKQGFEIGYWLKRGNNPHLNDIISNNANGGPYHSGLAGGKKEAEREQIRTQLDRYRQLSKDGKINGLEMD